MSKQRELPSHGPLWVVGILLVVFGLLSLATPAVAGKAVVIVIGVMLLLAGVGQVIQGLRGKRLSDKLPPLILGLISALCGLGLLAEPWVGMAFIALILAISFVVEGIYKIVASFSYRPASGWLVVLLSGLLSLVLGVLIWQQWPLSGIYAVGILVGINLLFTGISLLLVASTIRALRSRAA